MLLYITAEDVFGSDTPRRGGPRPLHTIPSTVARLYDLGMRHHIRKAALSWWEGATLEPMPDWRLDRLVIRTALYWREHLHLEPGGRVLLFGRLGWLWPIVDFAAMGFAMVPVGVEHVLGDEDLVGLLAQAAPRVAFATDAESAGRLRGLCEAGRMPGMTIVAEGLPPDVEGLLPLGRFLDFGGTLDTAERAQAFRAVSREIAPEAEALWHAGPDGLRKLTHEQAMAPIAAGLRTHPAREGDIAYIEGPRVGLRTRLAWAASVGDGLTTTVLGREGRTSEDVAELRPHKMLVSGEWLEGACDGRGPRWPAGLDRPWVRRRIRQRLGDRLRWVEATSPVTPAAARSLAAAGLAIASPMSENIQPPSVH